MCVAVVICIRTSYLQLNLYEVTVSRGTDSNNVRFGAKIVLHLRKDMHIIIMKH